MKRRAGSRTTPAGAPAPARAPLAAAAWLAGALALAAGLALRLGALSAPFFSDDFVFLDQARSHSLLGALFGPDAIGNFLRPVGRALWFGIWARLGGESPAVFHAASLALFALALGLLFALARSLAGARAAAVAVAFVALGSAADVAVRWASGSQDLLALTLALAALLLHRSGRRAWAAGALLAALLAKESVVATPLIAVLVARREGERWRDATRRAWPLFAALAAWAALWLATAASRPAAGAVLSFTPASVPAALVHLVQVAVGLEWAPGGLSRALAVVPPPAPLLLAVAAVAVAPAALAGGARGAGAPRAALVAGVLWAVLGALPVVAVAPIWSAYFYLFAMCGVGLALGAALARAPWWAGALALALLAWPAEGARELDEFAMSPDPWSTLSHVDMRYLERAEASVQSLVGQLRAQRPTLAKSTTVFFSGLPAWTGIQAGGGPLLRWAYHDSSLQAHYNSQFSLARAGHGPIVFARLLGGELTVTDDSPDALVLLSIQLLLDESLPSARDAMLLRERRLGRRDDGDYALAWMSLALGDSADAWRRLGRIGAGLHAGARAPIAAALAEVARGDTAAAYARMGQASVQYALDPGAHALLADLALASANAQLDGVIEAFVTRLLAPSWPDAWKRWAKAQVMGRRYTLALRSLDRYFALGGAAAERDAEAVSLRADLRRKTLGGDQVREEVRRSAVSPR